MQFRTFAIVAGSLACNARCPFCVARMTPAFGLGVKKSDVDWDKFDLACRKAKEGNADTVMFTGNGETTLFPDQITAYLQAMESYGFSNIEMQTNGILIAEGKVVTTAHLRAWRALALKTIAISIAHYCPERNREIFLPHRARYIDLSALIKLLHDEGFTVRFSCVMAAGWIDSVCEVRKLLEFACSNKVKQVTVTPVTKPTSTRDPEVFAWTSQHHLSPERIAEIVSFVEAAGTLDKQLPHGARIYDIAGLSLCVSNCLTVGEPKGEEFRNLIFFPNGRLSHDWQREDALVE